MGIVHVVVVDVSSSRISQIKEEWESQRKAYTTEFFEVDPCMVSRFSFSFFVFGVIFFFYDFYISGKFKILVLWVFLYAEKSAIYFDYTL